ncbi:hypothetical protein K9N68_36175 (plasmid) [Kovacikia minuta CCNUW1]|uniref:hypothetical protein n=1 Tax=Kovacikia minuta TaxID=2931930 RepID=UPI001CCB5431|nr:hypothetical protein [Kovacikia minuta]UBF30613.1 hypothetical protein K9N68_36175 [Kovacikia minuta CCNUW1]
MARTNGAKTEPSMQETPELVEVFEETGVTEAGLQREGNSEEIEDCLAALKTLLSTVEKLQKVRQDVGDIKPLLVRMLDGEVLSGEELEQLKVGVGGLFRLVRAYSDHQTALTKAQPARTLLDEVLKVRNSNP